MELLNSGQLDKIIIRLWINLIFWYDPSTLIETGANTLATGIKEFVLRHRFKFISKIQRMREYISKHTLWVRCKQSVPSSIQKSTMDAKPQSSISLENNEKLADQNGRPISRRPHRRTAALQTNDIQTNRSTLWDCGTDPSGSVPSDRRKRSPVTNNLIRYNGCCRPIGWR